MFFYAYDSKEKLFILEYEYTPFKFHITTTVEPCSGGNSRKCAWHLPEFTNTNPFRLQQTGAAESPVGLDSISRHFQKRGVQPARFYTLLLDIRCLEH